MTGCCVARCKSRSENGYRLFRLPSGKRNTQRKELWMKCIGQSDLSPMSMVCEIHFSEKQFEQKRMDNRKLLRPDAVPDLLTENERLSNSIHYNTDETIITEASSFGETSGRKRKRINEELAEDVPSNITLDDLCNDEKNRADEYEAMVLGDPDPEMIILLSDGDMQETQTLLIEKLRKALRKSIKQCSVYKRQCEKQDERLKQLFNEDQLWFLQKGSHRGTKWTEETLTKAVKLYLVCGEKGYEELRNQHLPYPSIRTIQHRLQNLKMEAGILEDIFNLMRLKMPTLKPEERHAGLIMDEVAIRPGIQYDNFLSSSIDRPTLNNSDGTCDDVATHVLVFMLAGITSRWKQTIAYEFTGKSCCAKEVLERIKMIITKSKANHYHTATI